MPCSACAVSIGRICAVCVLLLFVLLCFGGCEDTAAVGWVSDAAVTEAVPIDRDYTDTDAPLVSEIVTETAAITAVVQTTAEQTVTATETETETETEIQAPPAETVVPQPQRITIPRLSTRPIGEAEQILQDAGISYTVKEEYSLDFAAGTVMNVHFYGTLDDDGCHINPAYPVEVTVSLGTRRKTCVKAVDEKRIYLTFDDGPFKYTRQVLDTLEQYGVRATFFTLGRYAAVYPDLIRAIDEGGHLLACHSYSHDYMSLYASAETVLGEIRSWEKTIEAAGVTLPEKIYFRFPGGTTTTYMDDHRYEQIFWAVNDAGYYAMDWTCANNDRYFVGKAEEQSIEDYMLQSVSATLANASLNKTWPKIMLMHDTSEETAAILGRIIELLTEQGYTFGTLDELDGYWVFK